MHESPSVPPPVYEGDYLPPERPNPASGRNWGKGAAGAGIGIAVLLAKFKSLLFLLLSFKWVLFGGKILFSSFTFFASIWFYALFFGWPFAAVFVVLILVHELGHTLFMRMYGVPASLPYFIPGFGALVNMRGRPASALEEAFIALGGPLFGTLGALACYLYAQATDSSFWMAAAYAGFLINLFNLFPVHPLDGGRVAGAISPRIWIFGLVAFVAAAFAFHWWNPLILILIVFSIPQAIAAWRNPVTSPYYALSPAQRGGVAFAYFALAALLVAFMLDARVAVPGHA